MGVKAKHVIFTMGRETYGMDISHVKEIVLVPESIVRMPLSPASTEGIVNLRGTVVPVIDLKKYFGLGTFTQGAESRLLIFDVEGNLFAVLVDAVTEVLDLDEEQVERVGSVLPVLKDGMVKGIGKTERKLVVLLDADVLKTVLLDQGGSLASDSIE